MGDDLLIGGSNRDLLEGGKGVDWLIGGGNEDILIGGSLAFADLEAALAAITAEWNSHHSYDQRVANLRGDDTSPDFGDGENGQVLLTVFGESATVLDDAADDHLTGSADRDWFFANLGEDLLTDLTVEDLLSEFQPALVV